jgi:hypothetical protein
MPHSANAAPSIRSAASQAYQRPPPEHTPGPNLHVETLPQGGARRLAPEPRGQLLREAHREVINKIFLARDDGVPMLLYHQELGKVAAKFSMEPKELLAKALLELDNYRGVLQYDLRGRIQEPSLLGPHFEAVIKLVNSKLDMYVIHTAEQLYAPELPLSKSYAKGLRGILAAHESAILILVKDPPQEAVDEIVKVTKEHLGGMMSLWADPRYRERLPLSERLQRFLSFATVRLMTTGDNPEAEAIARQMNQQLEGKGGFEDKHWVRVVKQISLNEQHHALKESMIVCAPVLGAVQLLDKFAPALMHSVGGALDDVFGSIGPNIYQSFRKAGLTLKEKFMDAKSAIALGVVSIPLSAFMGHYAAQLFSQATTPTQKVVAGVTFAIACSVGTILSSAGAIYDTASKLGKLANHPTVGDLAGQLSFAQRCKAAFNDAILNVPFRIGHTLIGVSAQIGLGVAAGLFGFFNNKWFVAGEGMLESLAGIAVALSYPLVARHFHAKRLKEAEFVEPSAAS